MNEQIEKIEKQIELLKNRKQAMISREKVKIRKERTRELITAGAIAEKYLHTRDVFELEAMCQLLVHGTNYEQFLSRVALKAKTLKAAHENQENAKDEQG